MNGSTNRLGATQIFGLAFVLVLHGAALYVLWSYRIIPTADEALTLMVNLINPSPSEQPKPEPKPRQPAPPKPKPIEPPKPQQLAAEIPVALPDEPVAPAPPPEPVTEAPLLPPTPVVLSGELSVVCPERSPPQYPLISKRMNEQGNVVVRVEINEYGRLEKVTIETPSGYARLDAAAAAAVKNWHCKPAMQNGLAVAAVALQPFVFILEGR